MDALEARTRDSVIMMGGWIATRGTKSHLFIGENNLSVCGQVRYLSRRIDNNIPESRKCINCMKRMKKNVIKMIRATDKNEKDGTPRVFIRRVDECPCFYYTVSPTGCEVSDRHRHNQHRISIPAECPLPVLAYTHEFAVDFCISKCDGKYCNYMRGKGGFPCVEFICIVCKNDKTPANCGFCKGR